MLTLIFGGVANPTPRTLSISGEPTWNRFPSLNASPEARFYHTATFDPVRNQMIVFGGVAGSYSTPSNEIWALSLTDTSSWTRLQPLGTAPPGRYGHSAIYDSPRDRIVIFGGSAGWDSHTLNDVWSVSLTEPPTWTQLTPSGTPPSPRQDHAAIFDPVHERMLIFGGYTNSPVNDVWALSLSGAPAWSRVTTSGALPPGRSLAASIYDPVAGRMIIFGGSGNSGLFRDLWGLTLNDPPTWTELQSSDAPWALSPMAIYDSRRRRIMVFEDGVGTWTFQLSPPAWASLPTMGTPPLGRTGHSAVVDLLHDQMLIYGPSDMWALSLTGAPQWGKISEPALRPQRRTSAACVYDSRRSRLILYGGNLGRCDFFSCASDDTVWLFSPSTPPRWDFVNPTGTRPDALKAQSAIYDPVRDRLVLVARDSIWALPLANDSLRWELLSSTSGAVSVYDSRRDRIVFIYLHGSPFVSTFSLLDARRSPIYPLGASPTSRESFGAVFDPIRDRVLIFGGFSRSPRDSSFNDVWQLSLADPPRWSRLKPSGSPPPRTIYIGNYSEVYDSLRQQMIVFNGETWALALKGHPRWIPWAPAADVPSHVVAPACTIGDTAAITIPISSVGFEPLSVDNIVCSESNCRLGRLAPFDLLVGETVTEMVFVAPTDTSRYSGDLTIASNAFDSPQRTSFDGGLPGLVWVKRQPQAA